jgi:hypothetical protein
MALTGSNPFEIVDARSGNDLGKSTGIFIVYGDNTITPSAGTTATATTVNQATTAIVVNPLPFGGSAAIPNQFFGRIRYDTNLTGAYTLTFTNGGNSITEQAPAVGNATAPPFASNVTISGASLNPTFQWAYPTGSIDGVFFDVFDKSQLNLAGTGPNLVYSKTLTGTTNSWTIPNALAGGLSLITGHQYVVDIYGVKARNSALQLNNPNSLAWSESFFDFTPLPGTTPQVSLPTVNASTGAYQFSATVVAGQTIFIDPAVAIGYTYQIGAGDPNFASVTLPSIQTSSYTVDYTRNGIAQTASVAPGAVFTFPTGGVAAFTVTGVNPALLLNPANSSAFVTGLTFTASGTFTGTQTPLTSTGTSQHGSHDQFVVFNNNGSLHVEDKVGGQDQTQTLSSGNVITFTDGTGVFDPTGTAEDVARLYNALLQRAPDVAGLMAWTASIDDSHVPLSDVANSFATSPEFIQTYGSLSDDSFVQKLYLNALGRPAEAAGEQAWDDALASGMSRGQVAQGFAESPENRANTASIAGDKNDAEAYRLYKAALARTPDQAGQLAWSSALASGATPSQVAQGFVDSAEFQQKYGALSTQDFVSTLYQNALGRTADVPGLQAWTSALQGGMSKADVVVGFSDSSENRAQTASATHDGWVFIHA